MAGILLGLGLGAVQLVLLLLGVGMLGSRKLKIWALAVQFLCPLAGLLLCALVWTAQLLPCAVAMSAVLVLGGVTGFLVFRARDSHRKKD